MPSIIAISAGSSAPNRASTSAASHMDQDRANGAGRSSAAMPGFWRISASLCATTASASSYSHCSRPHASSWLQDAWLTNCENRLLVVHPAKGLRLSLSCVVEGSCLFGSRAMTLRLRDLTDDERTEVQRITRSH